MKNVLNVLGYVKQRHFAPLALLAVIFAFPFAALANHAPGSIPYSPTGQPGIDHPAFNVFNGVPTQGNEADFLRVAPSGQTTWSNNVNTCDGLVDLNIYVHNGAVNVHNGTNFNGPGVADGTRLKVTLPSTEANDQELKATLWSNETSPINDTATIMCGSKKVTVEYVTGSAQIFSQFRGTDSLSDAIVGPNGTLIGTFEDDGKVPGCWEYRVWVKVTVKVKEVEDEPEPILECTNLTALPAAVRPDQEVAFTATANADNGATITKYVFEFGDGEEETVTTSAGTASTPHAYDEEGTFDASVTVHFDVDGTAATRSGANCQTEVKVDEEPKDIQVCRDGKVITIKENERKSTDTDPPCPEEQIQVCRAGKVITIDEEDRLSSDTDAPCVLGDDDEKELPNTGIGSALAGFFGTSALFASARNWLASRKALRAGALNRG